MIRASGLTLRRGTKTLLDQTDFAIYPGERIGIVGHNGAGKTSLFKLIQNHIDADSGNLEIPANWKIASVEQILHDKQKPASEFVIDGDSKLRAIQAQRAALRPDQGNEIAELETALIEVDAWSAPARAERLLAGLGFAPDKWQNPVASFSGGWQMRIALARALMAPSDLLLLDEPTNHLDLDAMLWLEDWLISYQGTVLIISHDSEFLNAAATSILSFEQQKLVRYKGNYESFIEQRNERLRQNQLAIKKQAQEAAHLQSFIDRFKAKATKAKQAQSRIKALARMQSLTPMAIESGVNIRLPEPIHSPDILLTIKAADLGYASNKKPILKNIDLMIRSGARIGVLGVNGAGKSTLVKTLANELSPISGDYFPSKGLVIGYFAQHQLDVLEPESTPLDHFNHIAPNATEQELRNMLGGFGFIGEMVNQQVKLFSGGEKARLALALIVWHKPNLLLLDEPSNHLDSDTREALARALAEFSGSVLLVSHDRHLLRTTVDSFIIVSNGNILEFDGDLEDYKEWLRKATKESDDTKNPASNNRKEQRRLAAQERKDLAIKKRPLEKKLAQVESNLLKLQNRKDELDEIIADPDFYSDNSKYSKSDILTEHGQLSKDLDACENDWLLLQEQIEELNNI